MKNNIYYNIHKRDGNHLKVPDYILNDEKLSCVYYHCAYSKAYIRLFDRSCNFVNYDYSVILINPSDEDLTYLTLLGINYTQAFVDAQTINAIETLISRGSLNAL